MPSRKVRKMRQIDIEKAVKVLDDLWIMVGEENIEVALFIWMRYGGLDYISEDQIVAINDLLGQRESMFDSGLLDDVKEIVGF